VPVWCEVFCGSFFLVAQKYETRRIENASPLLGADFLLDQKTAQTSEATHEIKKSRPGRPSPDVRSGPAEMLQGLDLSGGNLPTTNDVASRSAGREHLPACRLCYPTNDLLWDTGPALPSGRREQSELVPVGAANVSKGRNDAQTANSIRRPSSRTPPGLARFVVSSAEPKPRTKRIVV
jgi:hypothetical protein